MEVTDSRGQDRRDTKRGRERDGVSYKLLNPSVYRCQKKNDLLMSCTCLGSGGRHPLS